MNIRVKLYGKTQLDKLSYEQQRKAPKAGKSLVAGFTLQFHRQPCEL